MNEELKHYVEKIFNNNAFLIALTDHDFVHVCFVCQSKLHKIYVKGIANAILNFPKLLTTSCRAPVHFGEDVRQKRCDCILNSSASSRDKLRAGWAALKAISLRLGENSRLSAPDHTLIKVCVSPAVCLQASLLVK